MSGRSRGRAKIRTDSTITPIAVSSDVTPAQVSIPQITCPSRNILPESGRGRGFVTEQINQLSSNTTASGNLYWNNN
jgi:hypothetical protein